MWGTGLSPSPCPWGRGAKLNHCSLPLVLRVTMTGLEAGVGGGGDLLSFTAKEGVEEEQWGGEEGLEVIALVQQAGVGEPNAGAAQGRGLVILWEVMEGGPEVRGRWEGSLGMFSANCFHFLSESSK